MAGYMDGYGVADAKREKTRKRIFIALGVLLVSGLALYFTFRNYREEKQVALFLEHLRNKQYAQAYRLWGCTESTPCRDYRFERFLEDWGEKSPHKQPGQAKIVKTRSCSGGIIQTLNFGKDAAEVLLFVNRNDLAIGFAPWPSCDPRIPVPSITMK
ncbi:MAG: hypothetical protein JJE04_08945 [Acidobacteriia bacterium]|nr:hypothetical protein [Terriglobia bacterium]